MIDSVVKASVNMQQENKSTLNLKVYHTLIRMFNVVASSLTSIIELQGIAYIKP